MINMNGCIAKKRLSCLWVKWQGRVGKAGNCSCKGVALQNIQFHSFLTEQCTSREEWIKHSLCPSFLSVQKKQRKAESSPFRDFFPFLSHWLAVPRCSWGSPPPSLGILSCQPSVSLLHVVHHACPLFWVWLVWHYSSMFVVHACLKSILHQPPATHHPENHPHCLWEHRGVSFKYHHFMLYMLVTNDLFLSNSEPSLSSRTLMSKMIGHTIWLPPCCPRRINSFLKTEKVEEFGRCCFIDAACSSQIQKGGTEPDVRNLWTILFQKLRTHPKDFLFEMKADQTHSVFAET